MTAEVDYEIVKAKREDEPAILEFMLQDFLHTEPLNVATDLKADEARQFFSEIVGAGLSCTANYVVRNPKGEIVALRWACIMKRNDQANDYTFESSTDNWKIQEIQRFLSTVESKIWEITPKEINRLFSWLVISVDKSYTRRGIAKKLLTYRLDEIRELGCEGMITTASAYNSQQLFQKLGYQELYAVYHKDWKDKDGNQIFQCTDSTDKASLFLKLF